MADVARNWRVPLPPTKWPQDTLKVPHGYGKMPAVDIVNSKIVKREYFTYVLNFMGVTWNNFQTQILEFTKDGDFWLSSVNCLTLNAATNAVVIDYFGLCTITDQVTGYNLFNGGVPIPTMQIDPNPALSPYRLVVANIIEPYCFLRGNSAAVTVSGPGSAAVAEYNIYMVFHGWKEYANAAI